MFENKLSTAVRNINDRRVPSFARLKYNSSKKRSVDCEQLFFDGKQSETKKEIKMVKSLSFKR